MSDVPRLGQRVRFTAKHAALPVGTLGMIDQICGDQFVVLLDHGAWFLWTTFESWDPTGEPDVQLSDEYKAARITSSNGTDGHYADPRVIAERDEP